MAKGSQKSPDAIEKLLAEKTEVERWLEKLDAAGNTTPKAVREKVRGDYDTRLKRVLKDLQGFKDDLVTSLDSQEGERERLQTVHAAAAERLAEAELRHSVGEYDEASWDELQSEIQGELDGVHGELETTDGKIAKLRGVIRLIDEGPAESTPTPEPEKNDIPAPVDTAGEPEVAELEELDDEIEDMPERSSHQTEAFDELAFLKSVTEDEEHGPSPARASSVHLAVDSDVKGVGAKGVEAVSEENAPQKGKVKKSLKCGECGAKNLPTEWYCERCGAELAAL